ncbi:two-partner secretion domain-containing protein [Crocosphaera sp. Alani8]|uniref:two-partner secretion domain-containing protein n=1 Tax=Crocosphaera sp. Alani8 TaxID=3038952 RepID=UPI00313D2BD7
MNQLVVKILRTVPLTAILLFLSNSAQAQISADSSTETLVLPNGTRIDIQGGVISGNNLFHSFTDFNVKVGDSVIFTNPSQITNIFTRITGNNVSQILGTIKVVGNANLFLINPNGIVFGPGASLDMAGSFYGTTADSIVFENGTRFSTNNIDENQSLLEVTHPVALLFENSRNNAISIRGAGHGFFGNTFIPISQNPESKNTSITPGGEAIALIANTINFDGGTLEALDKKIELSAVGRGLVRFNVNENSFDYQGIEVWGNINLKSRSAINGSGLANTREINLYGKNISLSNNSLILMQNFGENSTGSININATEVLELNSNFTTKDLNTSIALQNLGNNGGGSINVQSPKISITGGGRIESNTFSNVNGGNINIDTEYLSVNGFKNNFNASNITTVTNGEGLGGTLRIEAESIEVKNGAVLSSFSLGDGKGGAGNIEISATNTITLNTSPDSNVGASSFIGSLSFNQGDSGDVAISSKNISMIDGTTLGSLSFTQGNAGNVIIDTTLLETKGPNLNPVAFDLPDEESGSLTLSGLITSSASRVEAVDLDSIQGNAGNVVINAKQINLSDNGVISVGNIGVGNGGQLFINSDQINLSNFSQISSETNFKNAGNITLNGNSISLNQSQITSSSEGEVQGDGGNIFINVGGLLLRESLIRANANQGDAGNIFIKADALLQDTNSFITATSTLGIDGEVNIFVTEESEELFQDSNILEENSPEELISSCSQRTTNIGKLIIRRNNQGLPRNPSENTSDIHWIGLNEEVEKTTENISPSANKIIQTDDGRIIAISVDEDFNECSENA